MAWYETGTVTVTNGSATVTGSGTAFVANVQPGEALIGPDDEIYEIEAVVSDTVLTLADNYLGGTASAQPYKIMPVRGFARRAYVALSDAIATIEGHIAGVLSGIFPDGTIAAPGLRFASDPDTGLWRKGTNQLSLVAGGAERALVTTSGMNVQGLIGGSAVQSALDDTTANRLLKVGGFGLGGNVIEYSGDIDDTSLKTGFYFATPSSTGDKPTSYGLLTQAHRSNANRIYQTFTNELQGLFQRTYVAGTGWSDWKEIYGQDSILGTVSETAGDPTGALIESGDNANGYYVRFADGTQICWHDFATSATVSTVWTYPAAFAAIGSLQVGHRNGLGRIATKNSFGNLTASIDGWASDGTTRIALTVDMLAVGRWYT